MVQPAVTAKTPTSATCSKHGVSTRRQLGFTLVELLVVLGIAGLLIALAPVAYERMREGAQYRDVLRRITADLRQARQQAVTTGQEARFVLDLKGRAYGLQGRPPTALPESVDVDATVAGIELAGQDLAAIRFLPEGGATGGSLAVTRKSGGGSRITVDWLSGRLTQQALEP